MLKCAPPIVLAAVAAFFAMILGALVIVDRLDVYCSSPNVLNHDGKLSKPNREKPNPEGAAKSQSQPKENLGRIDPLTGSFRIKLTGRDTIDGAYHAQKAEGDGGKWMRKFLCDTKVTDFATAFFTLGIVILTGLLVGYGRTQAAEVKRTVDASVRSEAAILNIVITDDNVRDVLSNPISDDNQAWISFQFENYGKTPAILYGFHVELFHASDPLALPRLPLTPFREVMISQNCRTSVERHEVDRAPITDFTMTGIEQNTITIWFRGRASYRDVFGVDRETTFCLEYALRECRFVPSRRGENQTT